MSQGCKHCAGCWYLAGPGACQLGFPAESHDRCSSLLPRRTKPMTSAEIEAATKVKYPGPLPKEMGG